MSNNNNDSGIAALSICEALLLALNDAKVLPESEIMGILKDARMKTPAVQMPKWKRTATSHP